MYLLILIRKRQIRLKIAFEFALAKTPFPCSYNTIQHIQNAKIQTKHPVRIAYLRTKVFWCTNTRLSIRGKRKDGRLQLGPREKWDVSSRGRGRAVAVSLGKQYDEHSMKTGCLMVCSLDNFA